MSFSVTVKPSGGNLDMQNLMNIVNSVNIPSGSQPQTIVVMSNQKANGSDSTALQTVSPIVQSKTVQGMQWIYLQNYCFVSAQLLIIRL